MVIRIGTWNLENLFKPPNPFAPKTGAIAFSVEPGDQPADA
jgi:hypothetical protein